MSISRILGLTAAALVVVLLSANYFVGRLIQERLPQVLSDADGVPVTISNVSANLWRLRAYADQLTYGPQEAPLIRFNDLYVEISARDLLAGGINIKEAGSREADLFLGRFRERTSAGDADLSAAERWIPDTIKVLDAQFWDREQLVHEVTDFEWQMLAGDSRQASWLESRGGRSLHFQLQADSILEILAERGARLNLSVRQEAADEPFVTADLLAERSAEQFTVEVDARARSFQGTLTYRTESLFSLPQRSQLRMEKLDSDELADIGPLFEANPDEGVDPVTDRRAFFRSALPTLQLPAHHMALEIVELLGPDDEQIRNIRADLTITDSAGGPGSELSVSNFHADLPRADLSGSMKLHFGDVWDGSFDIRIETLSRSPERLRQFASTEWLWESGEAAASFRGGSLAELIESAQGEADLEGVYRGRAEVPIAVRAAISDRRGRIGADLITLTLGQSVWTGRVWLQEPREKLYLRLHTESFLATEFVPPASSGTDSDSAGWLIPEVTWWDSELQIDARVTADEVLFLGGSLTALDMNIQRRRTGSVIHASFTTENIGTLHAQAHTSRDGHHRSIDINVQASDIAAAVFADNLDARASGQFRLQGEGSTLAELLTRVNTRTTATLRFNQTQGEISVSGNPGLRMSQNRMVGLNFENIKVRITNEGLISGRLVYDIREPAIRGEVHSEGFDLDELLAILPASEAVAAPEFGSVLKILPNLDLQLEAESLAGFGQQLQQVAVRFINEPDKVVLENLRFNSRFGQLQARAQLLDLQTTAKFELSGTLGDLVVASMTSQQSMQRIDDPMSGTVELSTSGADWQTLAGNLRGHVRLQTPEDTDPDRQINVDLEVTQQGAGISAQLRELTYGASSLRGEANFLPGDTPNLTMSLQSDHLDLVALDDLFEAPQDEEADSETENSGGESLAAQADAVFDGVRSILGTPFQFFAGGGDSDSDRFFDDEPVDLSVVKTLESDIRLVLHDITSGEGVFDQLTVTGTTTNGILTAELSATQDLGGRLSSTLRADTNVEPYPLSLSTDIRNFRPGPDTALAPTSIFAQLTALGNSQAALAGSSNGEIYVEGGKGQADFANFALGFFTEDLLSRVAGVLLPEDDDDTPELNCSIAYGKVEDGVLTTPKGVMIQSRTANILIRSEVDMKEERLTAQFDTRSRTGAGVSVGNVFSNTVRIRGPLNDPSLVPNATGILWRGWAALATGGLSLLGESFVKRMLSSDKACDRLREDVQELVCDGDSAAAGSTLVCPAGVTTS